MDFAAAIYTIQHDLPSEGFCWAEQIKSIPGLLKKRRHNPQCKFEQLIDWARKNRKPSSTIPDDLAAELQQIIDDAEKRGEMLTIDDAMKIAKERK